MEGLPVFLPDQGEIVYVELCGEGVLPGVYQFYDGLALRDVILLTVGLQALDPLTDSVWSQPIQAGEKFKISIKGQKISFLEQGWMSASHRMAMSIPLHPDRMSRTDWQALPGVGAILAERIESDRQKNGEFGNLKSLIRVKGVGEKRLNLWKEFFGEV